MSERQKEEKQNITLDDLKTESNIGKGASKESNIVEITKDKNVTLDDIEKKLSQNNEELRINNEEGGETENMEGKISMNDGIEEKVEEKVRENMEVNNEEVVVGGEDKVETANADVEGITKDEEGKINNNGDIPTEVESINPVESNSQNTEEFVANQDENGNGGIESNGGGEGNQEVSRDNASDYGSNESTAGNNTNENNGENEKGEIVLDNLGDHINTGNTNVINVNDEKYSVNTTITDDDKSESNGENLQEAQNSSEGNGELIQNEEGDVEGDEEGVNLDEINISGENGDGDLQLDLSGGSLYDMQKAPRIKIGKITVFSVLITIISVIIGILAYFYNNFITHDLDNIEENRAYTFVETAKDFINRYKKGESTNTVKSINLVGKNGKTELDALINGNLNYIQKKDILDDAVSRLSDNIISKYDRLNEIRNDITRYGFFPKDLSNIISESEPISSIQNSLIALEAIKFSSAISVFSYLDTFTTSLVQSLGIDREDVEEKVGKVTSRGESDINIYIKNCYLNPFEGDYDCEYIGDFDEYYKKLNDDFDTEFFKELIKYTDSRLEQSEIPSFAISFKEFNQKDNEITFDIEINTLKEDEAELTKKGILSPHIFILNSLINSLRQSRFIVGDDISVKTLNVMPNTYIIGTSEINVNRSVNTFTVHIKKENAVEIDDFVYMDY